MSNSIIAKNYILTQALEDKTLTHEEVTQIMGSLFDPLNPTDQVPVDYYTLLKNTFKSYQENTTIDPSYKIQYQNKSDEEKMRYLLNNFPGSLEHYTNLLSKNGIEEPELAQHLPEVSLNYFAKEINSDGNTIFIFDVNLDDTNYVFEIDPSAPVGFYAQQTFENDRTRMAIFSDAFTLLTKQYHTNNMDPTEKSDMVEYLTSTNPFPAQQFITPNDLIKSMMGLMGLENNLLLGAYEIDQNDALDNDFIIPTYSDNSLDKSLINKVLDETKTILGEEILTFLEEQDIRIGFIDFHKYANQQQLTETDDPKIPMRPTVDVGGFYQHDQKSVIINTAATNPETLVYSLIHEIGHAINFVFQDNQTKEISAQKNPEQGMGEAGTGFLLTGDQRDAYLYNTQIENGVYNFPTMYGYSNETEWFAESFASFMIEQAGRKDLLGISMFPYNPNIKDSFFLADPFTYMCLDKITQTIKDRNTDPQSFGDLMTYGIDSHLISACHTFLYEQADFDIMNHVATDLEAEPGNPSETLEMVRTEWATKPLSKLYLQEDFGYGTYSLEDWVKRDFSQIRSRYMQQYYIAPPPHKPPMDHLAGTYPDFKAIQICMMLTKAKTKEEKINILIQEGLGGKMHLEAFYQQLSVLTPEELNPILNPNDLMSEAELAAKEQLSKHEMYMINGEEE